MDRVERVIGVSADVPGGAVAVFEPLWSLDHVLRLPGADADEVVDHRRAIGVDGCVRGADVPRRLIEPRTPGERDDERIGEAEVAQRRAAWWRRRGRSGSRRCGRSRGSGGRWCRGGSGRGRGDRVRAWRFRTVRKMRRRLEAVTGPGAQWSRAGAAGHRIARAVTDDPGARVEVLNTFSAARGPVVDAVEVPVAGRFTRPVQADRCAGDRERRGQRQRPGWRRRRGRGRASMITLVAGTSRSRDNGEQ